MINLGRPRSRAARALSVLLGYLLLLALAGAAEAQEKKSVVVLEIQGGSKKLQDTILSALREKYNILPAAKYYLAAKKLKVQGQAAQDVAMVASEMKADAVITGKLKQDKDSGGFKLNIAARNGQSGNPVGKMSYDLKSQKIDAETLAQVEKDIAPAVEKAIAGDKDQHEPTPTGTQPAEPTIDPTAGKEEDPIAKMRKLEEEQRRLANYKPRPKWYAYIDASVGFALSGRNFSFAEEAAPSTSGCYDFQSRTLDPQDPTAMKSIYRYGTKLNKCPKYDTSIAGGIHVDLTAYPLAFLNISPLRGLGLGVSFDYIFWPPSTSSGNNPVQLDTREFRFEVGLRYQYKILDKAWLPSILASIQYGGHYFAIAKQAKTYSFTDENFMMRTASGLDDHGLPDIFYQYITLGLGIRVPYFQNDKLYFGLVVNGNLHLVLNYGEVSGALPANTTTDPTTLYSLSGYGPVSGGIGLAGRASLTILEATVWRGLTFRLSGYYELFNYAFQFGNSSNPNTSLPPGDRALSFGARHIAAAASDNYFGGVFQVGYVY